MLVLKLLKSTKLTLHILFFFTSSQCIYFFCPPFFFNFFLKFHSALSFFFFCVIEKVEISNYNKCKLLIFTKKIEEPLSTRVNACLEASIILLC